jgi:hypothetical protein
MKVSLLMLILLAATACAPRQAALVVLPTITPASVCDCPTTVGASTQSQSGDAVHASVICNCPAIFVTPAGSYLPAMLPDGFTRGDNGKTFSASVGDTFLLDLGGGTYNLDGMIYNWTVTIDNPDVLGKAADATTTILSSQGIYAALSPGRATLTAIGVPVCQRKTAACADSPITFRVTLVVK